MSNKNLSAILLALFAMATFTSAQAAEQRCRLKGGSMVQLDAQSCATEGGTPIVEIAPVVVAPVPTAAETLAANAALSADPKLAAAQRNIILLLNTPLVARDTQTRNPEGIERTAKFDECRLSVSEAMHLEHGKIFASRMNLKIEATVDLKAIRADAYGVLGHANSIGGELKAYAIYFEEYKHRNGNSLSVSVSEQRDGVYRKYTSPSPIPYWDTPRNDLLMADEYGYPALNNFVDMATDKVRLLLIVRTENEAAALKKLLDEMRALCQP